MKPGIEIFESELKQIRDSGLWKAERVIGSPQSAWIETGGKKVLNLCANNYLGLSSDPLVIQAARQSYDLWGYGLSSVRFICGTQTIHKQLEQKIAEFTGMEDAVLYSSCFDANGGLFETLLGEEDAVISDALNHASIIDGIRLCKAKRFRYANGDMQELETRLKEAGQEGARVKLIATDGVFSMDGTIAKLEQICSLAEKHGALVMVDDSHAVGFMGKKGRGTPEYCGVQGRVDILTGTLGKALGGASGGYIAASRTITDLLRQRSRPYLFSNTMAPAIAAATLTVLDMLTGSTQLRDRLEENTRYFRNALALDGWEIPPSGHPIVPIMLYDARKAHEMSEKLMQKGVLAVAFSYPVVPKEEARIRVQVSAAHSKDDLDFALRAFRECREEAGT
jgi:glycine C-acetyltransferase